MTDKVTVLPSVGEAFLDERVGDRWLRVSWHTESNLVVLSLWHGAMCTGTFRLPAESVPDLIATLREGLSRSYEQARERLERADGIVAPDRSSQTG